MTQVDNTLVYLSKNNFKVAQMVRFYKITFPFTYFGIVVPKMIVKLFYLNTFEFNNNFLLLNTEYLEKIVRPLILLKSGNTDVF